MLREQLNSQFSSLDLDSEYIDVWYRYLPTYLYRCTPCVPEYSVVLPILVAWVQYILVLPGHSPWVFRCTSYPSRLSPVYRCTSYPSRLILSLLHLCTPWSPEYSFAHPIPVTWVWVCYIVVLLNHLSIPLSSYPSRLSPLYRCTSWSPEYSVVHPILVAWVWLCYIIVIPGHLSIPLYFLSWPPESGISLYILS